MSMTPRVAHKKTKRSTPMRRSHSRAIEGRAIEGEVLETEPDGSGELNCTEVFGGDSSSPIRVGSPAKGSLGSEIIGHQTLDVGRWTLDVLSSARPSVGPWI